LYQIYSFIRERKSVSYDEIVNNFSVSEIGPEGNELIKEALGFLSLVGIIEGNNLLKVKRCVNNELDFKIELLNAIHTHVDVYVRYFSDIIREIYELGKKIKNKELLETLRKVRREYKISDETVSDIGKFENFKPLIDYFGLLGKYHSKREVVYLQTLDPELLLNLLKKYSQNDVNIQIAEFAIWMNHNFLPTIDGVGELYNSMKNTLLFLETMGLIKMDKPADFRKVLSIQEGRKISRVVIM